MKTKVRKIKVTSKAGTKTKRIQNTIDKIDVIGTKEVVFYDDGNGLYYNIQPIGKKKENVVYNFEQHSPEERDLWFYYDDTNVAEEDWLIEYAKDLKIDLKKDVKKMLRNE